MLQLKLFFVIVSYFLSNLIFAKQNQYELLPYEIILRKSSLPSESDELFIKFTNTIADRIQGQVAKVAIKSKTETAVIEGGLFAQTNSGWRRGYPILYGEPAAIVINVASQTFKHCHPIAVKAILLDSSVYKPNANNMASQSRPFTYLWIKDAEYSSPCDHLTKRRERNPHN